ncbi:Chorismate dehydratase [Candidatus Desulfarcum epimagneticum]|uniref:Chorismate dehydratase n=1 Tax=uncultured Desulfobacteraceae bacterium TaxID=218296 RepID=A0A484HLP9_9BACT|nr:Chorismate dehydratase [uncultured Desulfobacteraceae bacterium]
MRLGYIDYLNCHPFYHHMFEKEPLENVAITAGHPSTLNRMMKDGDLDMSPISAGFFPEIMDRASLSGDFCLSSVGYVRSVILASKAPIEELDGKKVGLSRASRTSAALLKILFQKYYRIRPQYVPAPPGLQLDGLQAQLVIGNEALKKFAHPPPYIYDLGDLWLRKTTYPVVFAVFAAKKDALEKRGDEIRAIRRSFERSLSFFKDRKQEVVASAKKKYPDIAFDISMYYDLLRFEFTDELKKALHFYFLSGAECGLFKPVSHVEFF